MSTPMLEPDMNSPEAKAAMAHVKSLLGFIGDDPNREGLIDTPARVVKAMHEHFWGYHADPIEPLQRTFSEHHRVPFVGKAHVAYIPNGRVVGLSKLARVVDIYSKRLQVQEKLTAQIANAINTTLRPHGVAVVIQARHFCMCYRGVRQPGAVTTTSKLHGSFLTNPAARMELFTLLSLKPD